MMPKMAFSIFQTFVDEVRSAESMLTRPNDGVAGYVEKVAFLGELKRQETELNRRCLEINRLYELIEEHHIQIPDFEAAAVATLEADYEALHNAIEEVRASEH